VERIGRAIFEYRFRHRDGSDRWTRVEMRVTGEGSARQIVGYAIDINARKQAEQLMLQRTLRDPLTGLANAAHFSRTADGLVAAASHRIEATVAALIVSVRGVQAVRRTFGLELADDLLKLIGGRLARNGRAALVARIDGERYGLLVTDLSEEGALTLGGAIRDALERPFMLAGNVLAVQPFIGVAVYPKHADDARTLLRRADLAVDVASSVDARVAVYNAAVEDRTASQVRLMAELREAIDRGQLELHYQPIMRAKDHAVVALEALARWQHPRRGTIPPSEFIGIAEHTGLMKPLTEWALGAAIHQAKQWRARGMTAPISVNLSVRNLTDPALVNTVLTLLRGYDVPAEALMVEVTESAIMSEPQASLATLHGLRDAGIRIAIDDFGVGQSSLDYLGNLPADVLKLDRSFTRRLKSDARTAVIARSVAELGHALGFATLAEGVEDLETARLLESLGYDEMQGYAFARPMPAAKVEAFLAGHAAPRAGEAPGPAKAQREVLMVVDDDAAMRSSLTRMLARRGFEVLSAGDADEALALCDQAGGKIDLILSDVMLPGTTGPELAEKIARRTTHPRVLYMSGLPDGIAKTNGLRGLLAKPFSEQHLLRTVTEALA
jgi:diguanylate cyclase (GGDEF)-like protein